MTTSPDQLKINKGNLNLVDQSKIYKFSDSMTPQVYTNNNIGSTINLLKSEINTSPQ